LEENNETEKPNNNEEIYNFLVRVHDLIQRCRIFQKIKNPPSLGNFFRKCPQAILSLPLTDQLNLTQNRSKKTW
jgi:hypothetical protein